MKEVWDLLELNFVCLKTENIKWSDQDGLTKKYIDLTSVSRENQSIGEVSIVTQNDAPSRAKKIVQTQDIIFGTTRPTLRRVAVVPSNLENQICSTGFTVLRPNKQLLESKYLFYYLNTEGFYDRMESLQRGASYPAVTDKDVKSSRIPIPPLPEQKQIVRILDKAFAAIDQAKANIEKNIQNAQELFQVKKEDLFKKLTDRFIPQLVNEACDNIFAGGDAPKERYSKSKTEKYSIPIIANAVKDNGLYGYTDEARVTKPSITIAARGSGTGHTEFRDYPFLPIVRLIVLIPNTKIINPEYLMHAIQTLTIVRSGSAIPQLTVPMIKGYSIPVPDLKNQNNVVGALKRLKDALANYNDINRRKLLDLEDFKKSILQKAFSGELTSVDSEQFDQINLAAEPTETYSS